MEIIQIIVTSECGDAVAQQIVYHYARSEYITS